MSSGVSNCLVSRVDGQPIRMSVYGEGETNGHMIIFGDNGIILFDITTQSVIHRVNWDS